MDLSSGRGNMEAVHIDIIRRAPHQGKARTRGRTMSTSDVRRRDFLHLTATGAGAAAALAFLEGCKTRAFNKTLTTGTGADGSVRIRKAWEPGNTSDVNQKAYVEAVRILKDNDTKNAKYAASRGFFPGQPDDDSPQSWSALAWVHYVACPHGNWYFLPWYRLYLNYFEAACAKAIGQPDFSLPYWDWTLERKIPKDFFAKDSSLGGYSTEFFGNGFPKASQVRRFNEASELSPEFAGKDAIEGMLGIDDFYQFASDPVLNQRDQGTHGQLEGLPHNNTHGSVGGFMGMMLSPLDPIFWLHHCNVDRMWEVWKVRQEKLGVDKALPYDVNAFTRKMWLEKELRISFTEAAGDAERVECKAIDVGARETGANNVILGKANVADLLETIQWGYVYADTDVRARVQAQKDGKAGFAIVGGGVGPMVSARSVSFASPSPTAQEARFQFEKGAKFQQDIGVATFSDTASVRARFKDFLQTPNARGSIVVSNIIPPPNDNVTAQMVIRFFLLGDTAPDPLSDAAFLATLRTPEAVLPPPKGLPEYLGSYAFFSNVKDDAIVAEVMKTDSAHAAHGGQGGAQEPHTIDIAIEMTSWAKRWATANAGKALSKTLRLVAIFANPDAVADRSQNANLWRSAMATKDSKIEIVVRGLK